MCTPGVQGFCSQWRAWFRPLLILLYVLFVIIVVPLLIVNSVKDGFTRKDQLILIGGLFVMCAIPISIWQITQHIVHFTQPILQKHIIRILWMVPIYALNAWLCLLFPQHSIYMDSIRECYEAYVIYNFMKYLLNYLNLEMDLERTLEYKPPVKHIFPLCCMAPWPTGREFVHNCKHGILQYTVVRPLTTFVAYICEVNGVYGEGIFETDVAFIYIVAVNNCSQFIAMYCLVLFYRANKHELKPMGPFAKFLCIKAVIFFSFFQSVIIYFLVYYGFIKDIFGSEPNEDMRLLSSKLQNFLICIEMFVAALAHHYSFSHKPYERILPIGGGLGGEAWSGTSINGGSNGSWYSALLNMLDISDVHQDVSEHLGVVGSSLSRRLRGRTMYHMPRDGGGSGESFGGSEREYLVQTAGSSSNLSRGQCYQSGINQSGNSLYSNIPKSAKNRYGALEVGISIVKPKSDKQVETPNAGAPKVPNIFNQFQNSKNLNLMLAKSPSFDNLNSIKSEATTSSSSNQKALATPASSRTTATTSNNTTSRSTAADSNLHKSDSNNSDWLSTPDEDLGIDVKGLSNDRISYNPDRRV
ncbi:transmembrane protein 184C [Toxorhynchites rutilus septentrionalis]|uniref:transmembrane protein 184C n=1 Tax=Toxorhynchites rutilus septentrionalis TaxID=329112 RepID=UPI00247A84DF|nr:transmembrane protein 184C [Toxorhynchites rutilus septentrionalis]